MIDFAYPSMSISIKAVNAVPILFIPIDGH